MPRASRARTSSPRSDGRKSALPFPAKNPQPDRVSDRENAASFLAACPELVEVASALGCASAKATSSLKNRVGVFCRRASGRTGGARRPRRGTAPGCSARGYKPASGRAIDGNGNVIALVDMSSGATVAEYRYPRDNAPAPSHLQLNKDAPDSLRGGQRNPQGVSLFEQAASAATRHTERLGKHLYDNLTSEQRTKLSECFK